MNVQDITLDISKERPDTEIVRIGQGDSSGTTIRATVYDNGQVQSLSGMTATMEMKLPDGKSYASGGSCSISNNVITCIVDEEHFAAVAGYTDEAYFKLVSGTTVYSTSRFRVKVERAASNGADPASSYSDDIVSATTAARQAANDAHEAMEEIGTAVEDAAQAAESAAQAVQDAQTAIDDADTAKREATSAANAATAAANNANSKASAANTAANAANTAAQTATSTAARAEAAISAMGDISEQAVPVMSSDVRGGARIQPDSGLEVTDTDNLQVRMASESDGNVSGSLTSVQAEGHAEQFSTTGKNLLPNTATSQTVDGVTFTVDKCGNISVKGTSTQAGNFFIAQSGLNGLTLEAGTYTLSLSGQMGNDCYFRVYDGATLYVNITEGNKTFTLTSTKELSVYINFHSNIAFDFVITPQLELGSTATEYEPYTGAAPSPSPDYPQEIQVVRGRNLLSAIEAGAINSVTGEYVDSNAYVRCQKIDVVEGETYTISLKKSNASSIMALVAYNADGSFNSKIAQTALSTYTFTIPSSASKLAFVLGGSSTPETLASVTEPQIVKGSTPQPYVPYGHVGMEAQGRNWLPNIATSQTKNGITFTVNADGSVTVNGTASADTTYSVSPDVELSGTYVLSGCPSGGSASTFYLGWNRNGNDFGSGFTKIDPVIGGIYIFVRSGTTVSNLTFYPQLELGSTAHEYQPYYHETRAIPLPSRGWVAGLPDGTADLLRLDGAGHVEWTLPTKMETIQNVAQIANTNYLRMQVTDFTVPQYAYVLCDTYRQATPESKTVTVGGNTSVFIWESYDDFATIADYRAWLSTHNVTILYPLATPITEDMGYINMPSIPSDAVVTIPELDNLNIEYMVRNNAAKDYAEDWEKRATRTDPVGGLKHTSKGFAIDSIVQNAEDNTVYGGLAEVTAKGHAEQFSTTGKNLLPTFSSVTNKGVTFTVGNDGSVKAVGTSDDISMAVSDVVLPAGTYTLSGCPSGGAIAVLYMYALDVNMSVLCRDIGNGATFTIAEEQTVRSFIDIRAAAGNVNLTFYPQLELGPTATAYEPYTGGAPSPSPDYPQEIQVVRGRNLVFKTLDAAIGTNGYLMSSTEFKMHVAAVKNGETYTVNTDDTANLVCGFFSTEPELGSTSYNSSRIAGGAKTFVAPIDGYVAFRSTYSYTTPQLTLGSTPQPYVPYGHVGMEAQGRNLWDISNATDIAVYPDANRNLVSLSGQHTTYIRCKPNTIYTVSKTRVNQTDDRFVVFCTTDIPANGMSVNSVIQIIGSASQLAQYPIGTRISVTIQTGSTSKYIGVWYANSANYSNRYQENMQIEKSPESTPYEPYYHETRAIPLPSRGWVAGLSDGTADSLRLDGAGKWEWENDTAELVLNENSNCQLSNDETFFYYVNNNGGYVTINTENTLSESLIPTNGGVNVGTYWNNFTLIRFLPFTMPSSDKLAALSNFLTSNPIKILYPLATPTKESGYVEDWPTDIPEGAVITIPELDAVGIKYFIDSTVTELAKQWYERANSEYADRISALEQAVAELVTQG